MGTYLVDLENFMLIKLIKLALLQRIHLQRLIMFTASFIRLLKIAQVLTQLRRWLI